MDILKVAHAFESLNLLWLEDPIPPENVAAVVKVTQATTTPICTGENFYTRHGFREIIEKQGADIISLVLSKAGGLLEGRRIADLADLYYIPVAPHHIGSPIETIATCQTQITQIGVLHLGGSASLHFGTRSRHAHVPGVIESRIGLPNRLGKIYLPTHYERSAVWQSPDTNRPFFLLR